MKWELLFCFPRNWLNSSSSQHWPDLYTVSTDRFRTVQQPRVQCNSRTARWFCRAEPSFSGLSGQYLALVLWSCKFSIKFCGIFYQLLCDLALYDDSSHFLQIIMPHLYLSQNYQNLTVAADLLRRTAPRSQFRDKTAFRCASRRSTQYRGEPRRKKNVVLSPSAKVAAQISGRKIGDCFCNSPF